MYAHFFGKLTSISPTTVVIDCHGVGYELHISLYTYERLKDLAEARILAHLTIKEDAHTLYGFFDETERHLFRLLISVQGIGASTARMILSSLVANELQVAIIQGNVALLKSVKGVGPKSAQRIVLELQDKMQKQDMLAGYTAGQISMNRSQEEAIAALLMLGFGKAAVEKVVKKVMDDAAPQTPEVQEIIRKALKNL